MAFDFTVHHYEIDETTLKATLVNVTPYTRHVVGSGSAVNVRNGVFFHDNGEEIPYEELSDRLKELYPRPSSKKSGVKDVVK